MVTIPAPVWRGGFVSRALIIGGSLGLFLGLLAWLDSGIPVTAGIVFVLVGPVYGIWMARRMTRYWPESVNLTGDERVAVARAARDGSRVDDDRLAAAAAGYCRGLRNAASDARPLKWVLGFVLLVAFGSAVWDWISGSWGNAITSAIYLVALLAEIFWWPRRKAELLANAERTVRTEEHSSRKKR